MKPKIADIIIRDTNWIINQEKSLFEPFVVRTSIISPLG